MAAIQQIILGTLASGASAPLSTFLLSTIDELATLEVFALSGDQAGEIFVLSGDQNG